MSRTAAPGTRERTCPYAEPAGPAWVRQLTAEQEDSGVVVKTAHSPSFPAFYVYDHTTWIQEGDVYVEAYDATAIYLVDGSYWNQTGTVTVALGQSADGSFTTPGSVHQHPLLTDRSLTSAQCRGVRFQVGLVAGELDHRHGNQQIREYVFSHNSTTLCCLVWPQLTP